MKMKKLLAVLLAACVITSAGCGEKTEDDERDAAEVNEIDDSDEEEDDDKEDDDEAEETTTAEVTTTPEETTEEITEAVTEEIAEETTAADDSAAVDGTLIDDDLTETLELIKENAPIYGEYMEKTARYPIAMGLSYNMSGAGMEMEMTMEVYMTAEDRLAMVTTTDGVENRTIIKDGVYYLLSPAEEIAIYMDMTSDEMAESISGVVASMQEIFDPSEATFETGTTEYNGAEYLYEKINVADTIEIIVYADPDTKEIEYLSTQGMVVEILFLTNEVDESVFEIPETYTVMTMEEMMAGLMGEMGEDTAA